jgi:hypothetical protein
MEDARFEMRNQMIEDHLRTVGRTIKSEMPPGWGFTLMMFEFDGPSMFYMSSAQREGMIKTLQEFIQKLEKEK